MEEQKGRRFFEKKYTVFHILIYNNNRGVLYNAI